MAIKQSRLISLIAAAEDYQQVVRGLKEQAYSLGQNLKAGMISKEEALDGLLLELIDLDRKLKFPTETAATIADEKSHFRSNEKRNQSAAKRAEKKRRFQGKKKMPPAREGLLIAPTARTQPMQADHGIDRTEIERIAEEIHQEDLKNNPPENEPTDEDVDFQP